jgi:hypothetical protein
MQRVKDVAHSTLTCKAFTMYRSGGHMQTVKEHKRDEPGIGEGCAISPAAPLAIVGFVTVFRDHPGVS